jgi:hypothetical protein
MLPATSDFPCFVAVTLLALFAICLTSAVANASDLRWISGFTVAATVT